MTGHMLRRAALGGMMFFGVSALALALAPALSRATAADGEGSSSVSPTAASLRRAADRATAFLAKSQAADGSFSSQAGPGVTAIIVTGLLRNGCGPSDPVVAKALKYLEGKIQRDGGIYQTGTFYSNYETCLAMMALVEANRDGRYAKALKAAEAFAKGQQWNESGGHERSNPAYGGAGYGRSKRPDLSNTQFFVEALRAVGNGPDDPAIQKALIFVSRCQNLESEHNTLGYAPKNPDGGFYYTGAAGGDSMAGKLPNGGLRSYGSMTYAGLKSMIHAGVGPDDPRVKAAVEWLRKHYDLRENPGMGKSGLYYYYHTFAKALDAMQQDSFEDASGAKHAWRAELAGAILARQKDDGSWINSDPRWLEGDPNLVTGYALLTLSYCRPGGK
jgi:squalene-hopene/tetraprenyl-beta-curcumene cyclase